jgi:hypothetical protein
MYRRRRFPTAFSLGGIPRLPRLYRPAVTPVPTPLLDPIPLWLLFVLLIGISLVCYEVGFRLGLRRRSDSADEEESPTGMIVGSILALVAFMLAITMGLASDRFDARRGLVLDETVAIETAFMRAGYLPEPFKTEIQDLLREYVPVRIAPSDPDDLPDQLIRSEELQAELAAAAQRVAVEHVDSDLTAMFVDSINEVISVSTYRVTAGVYSRVPDTILLLLLALTGLSVGMVGHRAGPLGRRSLVTAILLVVTFCAVLTIVIDLDRPRDGLLQVSQRPLEELQQQIGPPP